MTEPVPFAPPPAAPAPMGETLVLPPVSIPATSSPATKPVPPRSSTPRPTTLPNRATISEDPIVTRSDTPTATTNDPVAADPAATVTRNAVEAPAPTSNTRQSRAESSTAATPSSSETAAARRAQSDRASVEEAPAENFTSASDNRQADTLATPTPANTTPIESRTTAPAEISETADNNGMSDELLLAGLAGLAGLGLAGGGVILSRRRKRRSGKISTQPGTEPTKPMGASAPVESRAPITVPSVSTTPEPRRDVIAGLKGDQISGSALIDQIDYAKPVGYYAASVDQGPTRINPFLTRKYRLRRAHFLDRQLAKNVESETFGTFSPTTKETERAFEPA